MSWPRQSKRPKFNMTDTTLDTLAEPEDADPMGDVLDAADAADGPEEPTAASHAIAGATIDPMLDFIRGKLGVAALLERATPRSNAKALALEDLFYCAHNAARSAQLGSKTAPDGFNPVIGGGVIHERRHALTWATSPGTAWDDTDLST